jgi:hypothetical protein
MQFRLSSNLKKIEPGPNTYLSKEEETLIHNWICESLKKGFPKEKKDIQSSVKQFLDQNPRDNHSRQNTPGER